MGSTDSRQAARDSVEMAAILFGSKERLKEMPVMVSLINSLSPLQYAEEMAGSIMEMARHRQPLVIANMIMAGTSGPVRLPGLMALMNAEILAGITLAQLAGPGTPVIYGTTSCPTNMKTIAASVGSPEAAIIASAAAQLARYYKLPCRSGGSLTDALVPDGQAMAEGSLLLTTSVRNGAHFILHACGMMGTYIGVNLEKWLIDEELCGMIRRMLTPVEITEETMNVESIKAVGIGGNYLMEPETLKHYRTEFFMNDLFSKQDHNSWSGKGSKRVEESAADLLLRRLNTYEKPDMDPAVEADLAKFVTWRKDQNKST
jgi:trimethylamine--corrinoid protein Co-methyltransferase